MSDLVQVVVLKSFKDNGGSRGTARMTYPPLTPHFDLPDRPHHPPAGPPHNDPCGRVAAAGFGSHFEDFLCRVGLSLCWGGFSLDILLRI